MLVRDAMSTDLLIVGTDHTLTEAARLMVTRNVGAAIISDPDLAAGPGIITERDILRAVADGRDPATTRVAESMTFEAHTATQDWDLDSAATAMARGGFRHLIVLDGDAMAGMLSMRDIVRARVAISAQG